MNLHERHSFSLSSQIGFSWSLSSTEFLSMMPHFFLHPVPQSCKMYHFCFAFIPLDHYETLIRVDIPSYFKFQCLWLLKSSEFFAVFVSQSLSYWLFSDPLFLYFIESSLSLHGFHYYLLADESQISTFSSGPRFPNFLVSSGTQLIVTWKFEHLQMKQIPSKTICFCFLFLLLANVIIIPFTS